MLATLGEVRLLGYFCLTGFVQLRARRLAAVLKAALPTPAVQLIPEKPNRTITSAQVDAAVLAAAEAALGRLANVKHAHASPADVHELPQTSNMEYGFLNTVTERDPLFVHNKGSCDVTKFASVFARSCGSSGTKATK